MSPKKILHINCNYIGTTLHQIMVENLDRLRYTNKVFVPTYDKNIAVIETNSNVYVSECFKKWDRVLFDYKQSKIYKALIKHFDLKEFDLIHAYTLFTDGNIACKISKKYHIPYVVAIRNTDVNTFFKYVPHLRKRGIDIMKNAQAVFFLSNAYKQQVFEKYIPKTVQEDINKKTYIIANGIDEFWINNVPMKKQKSIGRKIKLIYAGRIDKNKNIQTTQKAMDLLNNEGYDVSLTVVGKIDDKKEYEIIKKHKNTTCIPAQPKEKLIELYRNHDIFVMPSFHESFGLVYAEAMSQGLPVIYSKGQGFDGQFPEGEVGYHVDSQSENEIKDAIIKCIKAKFDMEKLIESSHKFSWQCIVKKYDEIYRKIK